MTELNFIDYLQNNTKNIIFQNFTPKLYAKTKKKLITIYHINFINTKIINFLRRKTNKSKLNLCKNQLIYYCNIWFTKMRRVFYQ